VLGSWCLVRPWFLVLGRSQVLGRSRVPSLVPRGANLRVYVSDLADAAKGVDDGGRDVDIATERDIDWPVSSSECGVVGERGTQVRPIRGFDCILEGVQQLDRNDDERVVTVSP
jgi:hypothetical protein